MSKSLRDKTIGGFLWTGIGTLGNGVVSFLVTMFLARLLTPYDFAVIELLIVFIAVANTFVDSGFSQAIIRDDNPSNIDLSSVFYFNIILSLIIYIVLFFIAPFIAEYFNTPELTVLSRVVFLAIIFNSFTIIQNATLSRSLNFELISKASVAGVFFAGLIAVIMAFTGFGVWAIVANMVLMPLFRSGFLWFLSKWTPIFRFSPLSIKRYFSFGIFLMLQGLLDTIVTNLTSLFIGKVYTKNDLGYYSQGGKFNGYIVTPLAAIVSKVTYPILASIKNESSRLKDGYTRIIGLVIYITLPISLFIFFTAENIIVLFFGNKWQPAGIYLQLFSIFGFFYLIQHVCINIVLVKGKTKTMLFYAILKQAMRLIAILVTFRISVLALAYANIFSSVVASFLYIGLGMYYIKYSMREFFQDNYQTIIIATISILLVLFTGDILKNYSANLALFLQCVLMFVTYFVSSKFIQNQYLMELLSLVAPLKKKILKK
jgi:O-antigen/teichoic acid export membrane protein